MPLNLIESAWIPVLCNDGSRRIIAPWQMAEADILRPDWPRADLNLGCLELLIGLVYLADPPVDIEDWDARRDGDPVRLREKLGPFAPAFDLLGDGPRFLQDLEPLDGTPAPVDMLFVDSAGGNTARNNADLMVHRGRYPSLDVATAAMALFTFQAHAPSGGAGNRTSMRGGGPMVTLADPQQDLWSLVWANVPEGKPGRIEELPWMRPTCVSDKKQEVHPPEGRVFSTEAFLGMPRRLRLIEKEGAITGVIQKPWGTNYALWKHPLSPHYRQKAGQSWLPKHPRAGHFGFRNWVGVIVNGEKDTLTELARCLRDGQQRGGQAVLVAGWSMDNMKPRDFIWSEQPLVDLSLDAELRVIGMIEAAEAAGVALRAALAPVLAEGESREAEREAFYLDAEPAFLRQVQSLAAKGDQRAEWLDHLRDVALRRFGALAFDGLDRRPTREIGAIVNAHRNLQSSFRGYGKFGGQMFDALGFDRPTGKKGKAA
ncbi:type I-E CRISPR-associated protein Cse1/CasA [Sedimentitalea sp. HM32M-2]|uniref:type I-E CRISPR-associated protein Cse1/CasA n=1 Tax=Sedimentitalea sp. HM32M-2 TaxID=3351566 RepID=UPI003643F437